MKKYSLSRSATSPRITREAVWKVWTDVNNWPNWDKGLEHCKLDGVFAVGKSFTLRPKGAPMDLVTTLIEVDKNRMFKDSTKMPLGTIEVTHEVSEESDGIKITHTIEAAILEDKIPAFENTLWAKWQVGLPNSVQNIINLIEASSEDLKDSGPATTFNL